MPEQNGKKTVSLILYVVTVLILFMTNAVAVTVAIMTRPTEDKVQTMINRELDEHSFLGSELKHIHKAIEDNTEAIKEINRKLK